MPNRPTINNQIEKRRKRKIRINRKEDKQDKDGKEDKEAGVIELQLRCGCAPESSNCS